MIVLQAISWAQPCKERMARSAGARPTVAPLLLPHWVGKDNRDNRAKPGGPQLYNIKSLRPCKNVTLSIENERQSNYVSFLWPCRRICFPLISLQMHAIPGLIKHGFMTRFTPVQPSQQLPTMAHCHSDTGAKDSRGVSLLSLFMHQNQTMDKNCRIDESNSI